MSSYLNWWFDTNCSDVNLRNFCPEPNEPDILLHSFNLYGAITEKVTAIKLACSNEVFAVLGVYDDTTMKWVFNYSVASLRPKLKKLLNGVGKINLKQHPCLCFQKFDSEYQCSALTSGRLPFLENFDFTYYLATSGEKTISELGFHDGNVLNMCQIIKVSPELITISSQQEQQDPQDHGNAPQKKKKVASGKRSQSSQVSYLNQDLQELHSKTMTPVLDELRPKLKTIRDRLNSLLLKKDSPKERRGKQRNSTNISMSEIRLDESLGAKAGKVVYPVLVGEKTNLYKTSSMKLSKTAHINILDLHGCSKAKVRAMLREGLVKWIDEAMEGEYPFVIPVNIICGGGNQVVSELVARFIRENPQVANRPKGIYK